jgi:4-amino-4-deoxy-L-arabinose transferase-like glycosyltransferase
MARFTGKWAQEIAAGNWLGNIIFHQAPLYPYFLALLMLLFGKHLFLVYLVQAVFSASSTLLVYSIAKKIQGSAAVGVIAGLLFAFYDFQFTSARRSFRRASHSCPCCWRPA